MNQKNNLLSASAEIVRSNKRYVVWFYLLNLLFAWWGTAAFSASAHNIMDHSLYSDKVLHGLDAFALGELFARPEFGPMAAISMSATLFAVLFFLASMFFMPGVLLGYSSDHRVSRQEFYRSCGHNIWRFLRVFVMFAIIGGIIAGILFGAHAGLSKAADQAANDDRIPFFTRMGTLLIIFLVMTLVRAWFDLAQVDVVLADQNATRRSVAAGFRMTRRNIGKLLGSYVAIAIVGIAILWVGLWLWHIIVPPASITGAFLVSQAILLLLLAVRFWQRAVAVAFYLRHAAQPESLAEPAFSASIA
jgi:hypothetical protein